MLGAELLQEGGHSILLEYRELKIVREAAPREARRDLWVSRRAAHTSDIGTCETVAMW
jgi:hypothetical protein